MTATEATAFDRALAFTLQWEGGKVDHPSDPGGRTAYGVTQATYTGWRVGQRKPPRDVFQIEQDEVRAIYRVNYWGAINGDGIAAVREKVALCVFDSAVQHGVRTASMMFQRTVHAEPDGAIGKVTLSCFRLRLMAMGEAMILSTFLERRRGLYQSLILRNPKLAVFRKGWTNRLNSLCINVGVEPVWDDLPPAA